MNVSVVDPFNGIVGAPNAIPLTELTATVTVAVLLSAPAPLSVAVIPLTTLFFTPVLLSLTLMLNVQDAPLAEASRRTG